MGGKFLLFYKKKRQERNKKIFESLLCKFAAKCAAWFCTDGCVTINIISWRCGEGGGAGLSFKVFFLCWIFVHFLQIYFGVFRGRDAFFSCFFSQRLGRISRRSFLFLGRRGAGVLRKFFLFSFFSPSAK